MAAGTGGYPVQPAYTPQPRVRFDALGEAFRLFQQQWVTWVLTQLVYLGVCMVLGFVIGIAVVIGMPLLVATRLGLIAVIGMVVVFAVLFVATMLLAILMVGGMFRMAVKQVRGEPIQVSDIFQARDVYPSLLGTYFLVTLATLIGMLLCIIPGYIVGALLMLAIPLVVDKRLGAVEALQQSWNALKGETLMATLFYVVAALIAGLFVPVTVPVFLLAIAVVYRDCFLMSEQGQAVGPYASTYPPAYPPVVPTTPTSDVMPSPTPLDVMPSPATAPSDSHE